MDSRLTWVCATTQLPDYVARAQYLHLMGCHLWEELELGPLPEASLALVRQAREAAQAVLADGSTPASERKAAVTRVAAAVDAAQGAMGSGTVGSWAQTGHEAVGKSLLKSLNKTTRERGGGGGGVS
jgi:hypothetical protein